MAVSSPQTSADDATDDRCVSIHTTSPERSVFIEENNADGWISTDTTVSLER